MESFKIIDNLIAHISINLKLSIFVTHSSNWREHKTKSIYTIWSITKGNVWIQINNKLLSTTAGDVVLFYPGDTYTAYTDQDGCSFLYNRFSLEMGNRIDIMSGMNIAGIIKQEYLGNKSAYFCKQFMECYDSSSHISFRAYALFISYLSDVFESAKRGILHFYEQERTPNAVQIVPILSYIHQHFSRPITIRELAEAANLSEKYFISFFYAEVGMTPKKYIIQCRMQLAVELLSDRTLTIADIASRLGYADRYSFSKAFKKHYDETPNAFRIHVSSVQHK